MATQAKQVAVRDEQPTDYSGGLLSVIERAARDPNVDIDKMERLIAMQERVQARAAEIAFAEAFADMQPKLPSITKSGQIVHRGQIISEFAEWENINEAILPIISDHGFSLSFKPGVFTRDEVSVTAILRHRMGHSDEATLPLPIDSSGAKNAVQGVGSTLSYAKRYSATLLLNITTKGEDNDGASSGPKTQHEAPRDAPFPQGPASNKTALKTMARAVWRDIEGAGDNEDLDTVLSDGAGVLEQMKAALPSWWVGGERDGATFEGLQFVIERKRRDFNAPTMLDAG